MKNKRLVGVSACLFLGISLNASSIEVFADASQSPEVSVTTGTVVFTPNTDPTQPLDPNDPNQPADPEHPTDPADPNNPGTGNNGPLSIDHLSNITFGRHQVNGSETTFKSINKDPYVQVSDTRENADGWTVTVAMTQPFTGENQATVKGTTMNWQNGTIKTPSGNTNGAPVGNNISLDADGSSVVLLKAEANTGQGTWLDVFFGGAEDGKTENQYVTLTVPGGQATSQSYQAEITWTLSSTPL
ncbi:hypothetical protein IGI37_003061 [Enterococcus sp. AZ194]|uniref:WxL domain-containing protein n=1 Tax=Enterococcus sp. AZ194 TaxID=2774629 RepID=UPI003F20EB38